jgi:hypothetical protein
MKQLLWQWQKRISNIAEVEAIKKLKSKLKNTSTANKTKRVKPFYEEIRAMQSTFSRSEKLK